MDSLGGKNMHFLTPLIIPLLYIKFIFIVVII